MAVSIWEGSWTFQVYSLSLVIVLFFFFTASDYTLPIFILFWKEENIWSRIIIYHLFVNIITSYIRILDFDWLIAGVFSCIFIFIAVGVFACGLNLFSLCAVVFAKTCFTFLPSRASNRQIHLEYFFFTFICKVTWLKNLKPGSVPM